MLNSYLIYIFAENHKSTLMKPTTYIDRDGLKDIPFFYCDTKEDEENKDFDIYYQGKLVLHDYNHCGHYLYTAAVLFSRIKKRAHYARKTPSKYEIKNTQVRDKE